MAKKIMAVVLGFVLAPAFIAAEHSTGTSIVGSTCLVRVYHTNFQFPPEGGRIVQIGQEMFYWKTYLPECLNMLPQNTPVLLTSHIGVQAGDSSNTSGINGSFGSQLAGNSCAIRVYHTNFQFPPEGGKIVQIGQEMFFVKTYMPGCESAGGAGTVLSQSTSNVNSLQQIAVPTTNYTHMTQQSVAPTQQPNTKSCF